MPKGSKKRKSEKAEYIAVRYAPGKEKEAIAKLTDVGEVNSSPTQQLAVVKLSGARDTATVLDELQPLLDDGTAEFITPVLIDQDSNLKQIPTEEITVRFKEEPTKKHLQEFGNAFGVKVDRQNEFVPRQYVVKLETRRGKQVLEAAQSISQADEVEFATPNYLSEIKK